MKVLKFGAIWCNECLVMKPMWAKIELEISELKTEYYDADDNSEVLKEYDVKDIPVFIFLDKNQKEFLRLEGTQNKEELVSIIRKNLDK